MHPVEVAIELLNHYRGREDVYLSTQRFRGRRRVAHLLSLASLYADLDYYRVPELAGSHPKKVLELALAALGGQGCRRSPSPWAPGGPLLALAPLPDTPRHAPPLGGLLEGDLGGPRSLWRRPGLPGRGPGAS